MADHTGEYVIKKDTKTYFIFKNNECYSIEECTTTAYVANHEFVAKVVLMINEPCLTIVRMQVHYYLILHCETYHIPGCEFTKKLTSLYKCRTRDDIINFAFELDLGIRPGSV